MSHVRLRADLDAVIARHVAPRVQQLADEVAAAAAANAPSAKMWVTEADERVRHSHATADGQTIPENLRYVLDPPQDDNAATNTKDLAREPRDPALPQAQRLNCRCGSFEMLGAVGATIRAEPAVVEGARVLGRVVCPFHRAAESEFPGDGDGGGHWMRDAAQDVAARHR